MFTLIYVLKNTIFFFGIQITMIMTQIATGGLKKEVRAKFLSYGKALLINLQINWHFFCKHQLHYKKVMLLHLITKFPVGKGCFTPKRGGIHPSTKHWTQPATRRDGFASSTNRIAQHLDKVLACNVQSWSILSAFIILQQLSVHVAGNGGAGVAKAWQSNAGNVRRIRHQSHYGQLEVLDCILYA